MKRILITGVNSYVGNSFAEWMKQYPENYEIDKISLRNGSWREMNFSKYDSILHVAGIAHRKETKKNTHLYYEVNRDITKEIADRAKKEGVPHFVFLSTMSVYGLTEGVINKETPLKPKCHYGKSKLLAEEYLNSLANESFKVAILRPPMIYGKGCKGNYQKLRQIALITPVFPSIRNKRSMIYIGNLSIYIKNTIDQLKGGFVFPQNKKYVNTTHLVKMIAETNNKKTIYMDYLNSVLRTINLKVIKKVFGNLFYDNSLNDDEGLQSELIDFEQSIKQTEETDEKDSDII